LKFNYICLSFYIRAAIPFVFLHQGVIDMRIDYLNNDWIRLAVVVWKCTWEF